VAAAGLSIIYPLKVFHRAFHRQRIKSAAYALENPPARVSYLISRRISSGGGGGTQTVIKISENCQAKKAVQI